MPAGPWAAGVRAGEDRRALTLPVPANASLPKTCRNRMGAQRPGTAWDRPAMFRKNMFPHQMAGLRLRAYRIGS